ncbi:hypothetical protein BIY22_19130 [Vibrio panuliri]|uniref:Uncharacterized protein n=1 Tax=Vibrio panuliri TaxID=1381081 RepID=A0A1Q9HKX5_9VIBR|nr:cadherin-like domain-containing protein [Vibrio panuliri]OLQ91011.1 hypothetical protein BIY22_19130 [Vibrio panuliri]
MGLGTLAIVSKLAVGQAVVIDAEGNARIVNLSEPLNDGEVIIQSNPDESIQATLVNQDGDNIDITNDVAQVIEAIEQGQDPAELEEEFASEAGSEDSSSGTVLDSVSRDGSETIANTLFETEGLESIGLSTTQSLTLLEQFRALILPSILTPPTPDTPPLAENFTVELDSFGRAAVQFNSEDASQDHISDLEDDASNTPLGVVITSLPQSGTLLYDGEPVTDEMLTEFDDQGNVVGDLQILDPELFSYQNDDQSTGFILGVKNAPDGRDGDESSTAFLNWGESTDDPNVRVLTFTDDENNIVDQITITTSGGAPTQYYADKNHIGYGLGVGGGDGINQGETINIDLSQRPAESVTLGLDGMGGWFEEGHPQETQVVIRVTLDDGSVIEQFVTKNTSGNTDLFREITVDVPESSEGAKITNVEVSTLGPGNWELRYLETNVPDDAFDYRAVDSSNNVSEERTVTLAAAENTPPVAIDDPMGFSVAYGTYNNDVWEFGDDEVVASYDGEQQQVSGDGIKRGVSGDENGGPANQIQYNREEGKSEQLTFNLEKPATQFSFTFSNLFLDEGGDGNHEQGKWVAYLGDTAVASEMFIANDGDNQGTYTFSGDVAFDRVVFEAVDFVNQPARGSDSSDYFLTGFTASGPGAYAANQGEVLQIPIEELLGNDFDPDSDQIRFTHVSEANNAQIWVEDGIVYVDLDDDFTGPTTFEYEITDDKGGFAEATVSIIVNPQAPDVGVTTISLLDDTVPEGDSLMYKVVLEDGVLTPTEYDIIFGSQGDTATHADVDLSNVQFTNGVTYDSGSGKVLVPIGVSAFTVIVPTVEDNEYDNEETFTLQLGGASAQGTILDLSDTPPESEDFNVALNPQGEAAVVFNSDVAMNDHISDLEDDIDNKPLGVVITSLPQSGTLLYDGDPVTESMITQFDEDGAVVGELNVFDPDLFTYQNDDQSTGFILGVKNAPEGLDGDESNSAFLNWGQSTDDPNVRVLNFTDDEENIVDQIFITTSGGAPTQYYADKNHIGYGLGVGGGNGINQGETITIDMSQRPAESVTLGLDGMGGWFEAGHPKETKVMITATLDDGTVIEQLITKNTSGNSELFKEITIDVPDSSSGAKITHIEASTMGPGNWELRYLETNTPDDSFDYRAIDSDNNVSDESTVTLIAAENTPPVAIDDPMGFHVAYGTFDNDMWQYQDGDITAAYNGQEQQVSGSGLKRGVTGDENGGPANQIQYNREEGLSEQFTFNLAKPATEFSFTFSNLYKNEGGPGNHEQGKWVAYLGNTAVASGMFIANQGSNYGSYSFSDDIAFDRVVFEAVDFVNEPARGMDSSDYFLTGFTASGSGAYAANQGEVLQIPVEELLGNDFDPDSDQIRFTHVSEANNAQIWVEDGIVYVDLDDDFTGPTTFDYEITDDKGGFAEATVNIIVNPVPEEICVHCINMIDDVVVEGDHLLFKVFLNAGPLTPTMLGIEFGHPSDSADAADIDLANVVFTHGVTYDEQSGKIIVPVGVSEFSVVLPTVIDDIDDNLEEFTLIVDGVSSTGTIADITIEQEDDTIISFHDFDQIDVGRWSYIDAEELNDANTVAGISDGAEGVWGTDNAKDSVEVGKESVYRHTDDKQNQVLELEARRGDNQLFTELSNTREGQFFTLAFDVARRGNRLSPMAIFLESADGVSKELLYTYDQSKDWTSEIIHFQTATAGDYRVTFESTDADSYGALLDNIKLETLNNVGFEDGYLPVSNISVNLGSDQLNLDDFKVKLDLGELPNDTKFKIGDDELVADGNGYVDVSSYDGDLSGLSVQVSDPGNYSFDVVVFTDENVVVKTSPIDITVLPQGSMLQQGTEQADTMEASLGDDILFGFGGGDTFVWQFDDFDGGLDVIHDFKVGEDQIDLSDILEPGETIDDILDNVSAQVNDNDVTLTITKGGQSQSIQINDIADQIAGPINEQLSLLISDPNP